MGRIEELMLRRSVKCGNGMCLAFDRGSGKSSRESELSARSLIHKRRGLAALEANFRQAKHGYRVWAMCPATFGGVGALLFFCTLQLLWQISSACGAMAQDMPNQFVAALAAKVKLLEKENAAAVAGVDGWLFLTADLRFLSAGRFWGDSAAAVSRAPRPDFADPLPAILDFNNQLKERGIHLLVVPVPAKAAIYPEKLVPELTLESGGALMPLDNFYEKLREEGVDVLDLAPRFLECRSKEHEDVFCKTDTHWSGVGCVLAAQAIAERLRDILTGLRSPSTYASQWVEISLEGDLSQLLGAEAEKPGPEKIPVRRIVDSTAGSSVAPDPNSSLLLLGDSFTLVFHDFYATNAGLLDQLALELGICPDLIGTRGSGASAVRVSLYRRAMKDPGYLAKKKIVIWCFASREFTEAAQGWPKLPLAK